MRRIVMSIACAAAVGSGCQQRAQDAKPSYPSGVGASAGITTVLTIADINVVRVEGETNLAQLQVQLSGSTSQHNPVTVQYATADGTAVADEDYRPASGTLTFLTDSSAPQSFDVTLIGGSAHHQTATFSVILSNPVNATIGRSKATVTVVENRPPSGRPTAGQLGINAPVLAPPTAMRRLQPLVSPRSVTPQGGHKRFFVIQSR